MYEQFYGLTESPFSLTPDPKFFFRSESHIRAYELLRYGLHRGEGFIAVYGNIGTGKTTLCRTVLQTMPESVYTALLLNPFLSEMELLRAILRDFGVISPEALEKNPSISKDDLIASLNTFLLAVMEVGGRGIVVIDEAQNIPVQTLEQIRILSNLETSKQKLLQIVLVGQSELKDILALPELRQLNQRISLRCELEPLSPADTARYISHRIATVSEGPPRAVFTKSAVKRIYAYSNGTPRLINLIADRCLTAGLVAQAAVIDGKITRQAIENLQLRKLQSSRVPIALVAGTILLILFLWMIWAILRYQFP